MLGISLFFLTVYLLMLGRRTRKKGRSGDCERPSSVPAWVRRFTNKSSITRRAEGRRSFSALCSIE